MFVVPVHLNPPATSDVTILLVYFAHQPTIDLYNNEKRRPKPKSQTDGIDDLCPTLTARPFHPKFAIMVIISMSTIANIKLSYRCIDLLTALGHLLIMVRLLFLIDFLECLQALLALSVEDRATLFQSFTLLTLAGLLIFGN
jgi:hypothetical protein